MAARGEGHSVVMGPLALRVDVTDSLSASRSETNIFHKLWNKANKGVGITRLFYDLNR